MLHEIVLLACQQLLQQAAGHHFAKVGIIVHPVVHAVEQIFDGVDFLFGSDQVSGGVAKQKTGNFGLCRWQNVLFGRLVEQR